jgi:hypothetical protein
MQHVRVHQATARSMASPLEGGAHEQAAGDRREPGMLHALGTALAAGSSTGSRQQH